MLGGMWSVRLTTDIFQLGLWPRSLRRVAYGWTQRTACGKRMGVYLRRDPEGGGMSPTWPVRTPILNRASVIGWWDTSVTDVRRHPWNCYFRACYGAEFAARRGGTIDVLGRADRFALHRAPLLMGVGVRLSVAGRHRRAADNDDPAERTNDELLFCARVRAPSAFSAWRRSSAR